MEGEMFALPLDARYIQTTLIEFDPHLFGEEDLNLTFKPFHD
jgi:hypothetical protein